MKVLYVMDELETIKPYKDSSFAMMLVCADKAWNNYHCLPNDLVYNSSLQVLASQIDVKDTDTNYCEVINTKEHQITDFDIIVIRTDPPFDDSYLFTTLLLEHAVNKGVKVINSPTAIRDYNEKLAILNYPELAPETLVTSKASKIKEFLKTHKKIILKPLDGMAGRSIFTLTKSELNVSVIIETITQNETQLVMVQPFLEAIKDGDKRVLMVHGKPIKKMLARIPSSTDFRGNIAKGATVEVRDLTAIEQKICNAVAPKLIADGLVFVGLDIIGDRLTEINVTSPTGIREIEKFGSINAAKVLFDAYE